MYRVSDFLICYLLFPAVCDVQTAVVSNLLLVAAILHSAGQSAGPSVWNRQPYNLRSSAVVLVVSSRPHKKIKLVIVSAPPAKTATIPFFKFFSY